MPPSRKTLSGRFVEVQPVDPAGDAPSLFSASHGTPEHDAIWTYLPYGPFRNAAEMENWLESLAGSSDPLFLSVHVLTGDGPVGMASFMGIVPAMRRIELGHIWYGLEAQRSKTNTETIYLMLCEAFDVLAYRRVEWKCDSLNARSRTAALRLGFTFEGIFRQHVIYKGRSRDTAWFAMMDYEWPSIRTNFERWLYDPVERGSLAVLNAAVRTK